jgi:RimJ/RimL family protein N-acetyltransferase
MVIKKMVGKKCYLSPYHSDYAQLFLEWMNDFDVIDTLPLSTEIISLNVENEIVNSRTKRHSYMIVDIATDNVIGSVSLSDINQISNTAELGLIIGNKEYWNMGYGKEASSLLLKYAFEYLNLNNIMLQVYDYNENAIHLYKDLGFKEIGRRRDAIRYKRKLHDIIFMDLLFVDYNNKYE